MKTAHDIIEYAGRDRLMAAVNVKEGAVRMALKEGKLPASWYHALEQLCGRPLDRSLFTFKGQGK